MISPAEHTTQKTGAPCAFACVCVVLVVFAAGHSRLCFSHPGAQLGFTQAAARALSVNLDPDGDGQVIEDEFLAQPLATPGRRQSSPKGGVRHSPMQAVVAAAAAAAAAAAEEAAEVAALQLLKCWASGAGGAARVGHEARLVSVAVNRGRFDKRIAGGVTAD